jgi:hypothetical protein
MKTRKGLGYFEPNPTAKLCVRCLRYDLLPTYQKLTARWIFCHFSVISLSQLAATFVNPAPRRIALREEAL